MKIPTEYCIEITVSPPIWGQIPGTACLLCKQWETATGGGSAANTLNSLAQLYFSTLGTTHLY